MPRAGFGREERKGKEKGSSVHVHMDLDEGCGVCP